jgi:hypothetical protein
MDTVIWAAAITGAVGVLGNAGQYFSTRRQTRVELAKVFAAKEAARFEHVERARKDRKRTYVQFLGCIHELDRLARQSGLTASQLRDAQNDYSRAYSELLIDAPSSVSDAATPLIDALAAMGETMSHLERKRTATAIAVALQKATGTPITDVYAFQQAWARHDAAITEAQGGLAEAMHVDVTAPLLDEQQ